jgi:hypothetical protein
VRIRCGGFWRKLQRKKRRISRSERLNDVARSLTATDFPGTPHFVLPVERTEPQLNRNHGPSISNSQFGYHCYQWHLRVCNDFTTHRSRTDMRPGQSQLLAGLLSSHLKSLKISKEVLPMDCHCNSLSSGSPEMSSIFLAPSFRTCYPRW